MPDRKKKTLKKEGFRKSLGIKAPFERKKRRLSERARAFAKAFKAKGSDDIAKKVADEANKASKRLRDKRKGKKKSSLIDKLFGDKK